MIHTKPPDYYITPSEKEMRAMAERLELKKYSQFMVRDLANVAAGGEIQPESHWVGHIRPSVTLEPPDSNGVWELWNGGYSNNRDEVIADRTQVAIRYHRNISDFLRGLDFEKIPGRTPLEQAMNTLKLLSQHEGGEAHDTDGVLPIFLESDTEGNETADTLNELIDDVESLDTEEQFLLQETPEPSDSSGVGSESDLQKMALASDMDEGKHIWLEVSRNLEASSKLQVRKSVKFIPDREGDEVRVRPIANLGELPKIQVSEYTLPETYRLYRAAAKVSPVRERVRREEKQQLLYILIDSSGSMSGEKIHQAGGVLMNRLKAVVSGDAQVYARFFDTQLHEEHFAATPSEAKALIREFEENNFSGGGTEITESMKAAQKRIEALLQAGKMLTRPELVIVTDGQDNLSELHREDFGLTKVHAFVIDNSRTELVEFARSTGGVGVQIQTQPDDIPF